MMALEPIPVVKVQGERSVHPDGGEMRFRRFVAKSENSREKLRRGDLVARWHYCVVEFDSHNLPPQPAERSLPIVSPRIASEGSRAENDQRHRPEAQAGLRGRRQRFGAQGEWS